MKTNQGLLKKIAIVGNSGYAQEIVQTLLMLAAKEEQIAYFVEKTFIDHESRIQPQFALDSLVAEATEYSIYFGLGDGKLREQLSSKFEEGLTFPNLIHPMAVIGSYVQYGLGFVCQQFATVTTNVILGNFCQLNVQSGIGHDCVIGDFFTGLPASAVLGNVHIGNHVTLGANSTVLPGVSICDHVFIGAGGCSA